ncbi:MAG: porin family protein [Salinivirgaceae bacterium]|nr:porin family protein [Salinivirgaceae bacterium]
MGLKAQFSVGARGGFGAHGAYFEHPSLNNYQEPYYKANGGLVIIYNNDQNVGIQTEINYTQKGWQEIDTSFTLISYNPELQRIDTTKPDSYFHRNINYLEVPFFSHWEIGYGKIKPIIFAGPYLAWKLSESRDSSNFSHIWHPNHKYKHYEQKIRDLDFGIKFGLGLRYDITEWLGIYIDVRIDLQVAGGRDIFIDHPVGVYPYRIQASRLKETSGTFGILWHIIPQKKKEIKEGYTPKEHLYDEF